MNFVNGQKTDKICQKIFGERNSLEKLFTCCFDFDTSVRVTRLDLKMYPEKRQNSPLYRPAKFLESWKEMKNTILAQK